MRVSLTLGALSASALVAAYSDESTTVFLPGGIDWNQSMSPLGSNGPTTTWAIACANGDDGYPNMQCSLPTPYLVVTLDPTSVHYSQIYTTTYYERDIATQTTYEFTYFHDCTYTSIPAATPIPESIMDGMNWDDIPTDALPTRTAHCTGFASKYPIYDQSAAPGALTTYSEGPGGGIGSDFPYMTVVRDYTLPAPLTEVVLRQTATTATLSHENGNAYSTVTQTGYSSTIAVTMGAEVRTLTVHGGEVVTDTYIRPFEVTDAPKTTGGPGPSSTGPVAAAVTGKIFGSGNQETASTTGIASTTGMASGVSTAGMPRITGYVGKALAAAAMAALVV